MTTADADIDELLTPAALSRLTGQRVTTVRQTPLGAQASAWSGSGLTALETDAGRLILKRVSPAWDYFQRASADDQGREARIWTSGLLDRLPAETGHACLAAGRAGDGWFILMRDVGPALLPRPPRLTLPTHDRILDALAALHAAFWEAPDLATAGWLCAAWHHYHVISPAAAARDPDQAGVMPQIVRLGWDALPELLDAGLARQLRALADDPTPLTTALARLPQTLVHADPRPPNLGVEPDGRVLLLDWALAGPDVAPLDAVWYIAGLAADAPLDRDASLARYELHLRRRLGPRFDPVWWEPMRDLSLLGGAIRRAWIVARAIISAPDPTTRATHHAELSWWTQSAHPGLTRLQ